MQSKGRVECFRSKFITQFEEFSVLYEKQQRHSIFLTKLYLDPVFWPYFDVHLCILESKG